MKIYYLSRLVPVGLGVGPQVTIYQSLGVSMAHTIPSAAVLNDWALSIVSALDHTPILADARIIALPVFPFDVKVSSMNRATRDQMVAGLASFGIDTSFVASADGFREVIRTLGLSRDPAFHENNFDVPEI